MPFSHGFEATYAEATFTPVTDVVSFGIEGSNYGPTINSLRSRGFKLDQSHKFCSSNQP